MVVLSLAVGIRTGLLQKVASYTEPKTSVEIAQDTRLKERYECQQTRIRVCVQWDVHQASLYPVINVKTKAQQRRASTPFKI